MKYISLVIIVLFPLFIMDFENTANCKTIKNTQGNTALTANPMKNQEANDLENNKEDDNNLDSVNYIEIAQNIYDKSKKRSVLNKKEKKKKKDEPTFSEKCSEFQKKSHGDKVNHAILNVVEEVKKTLQQQESGESNKKQGTANPVGPHMKGERKNISATLVREVYSPDEIKLLPDKKNTDNINQINEVKALKEKELKGRNILLQEKNRLNGANEFIKTECHSSLGKDPKSKLIKGE